jgi:Holliday junction resolvase-like predicted endonuclease
MVNVGKEIITPSHQLSAVDSEKQEKWWLIVHSWLENESEKSYDLGFYVLQQPKIKGLWKKIAAAKKKQDFKHFWIHFLILK